MTTEVVIKSGSSSTFFSTYHYTAVKCPQVLWVSELFMRILSIQVSQGCKAMLVCDTGSWLYLLP